MRRGFHIALIVLSVMTVGLLYWQGNGNRVDPEKLMPSLKMAEVGIGAYNLTILVPNSLGRKYYSKPVSIKQPFQISLHEITIDQWNKCFEAGGCSHQAKQRFYQSGNHPVTRVSWQDAMMFSQWFSEKTGFTYRLPTEEEWAYVAFAGQDFTKKTI